MTKAREVEALPGPELAMRCAERILGWTVGEAAAIRFRPHEDIGDAMLLVERLAGADFVLHRFASGDPGFWMAWFGDTAQATAPTAPLATCRAALLYALGRRAPRAT